MSEKAAMPDWEEIVRLCSEKMAAKHRKFGDDWLHRDRKELLGRISMEYSELADTVKHGGDITGECIDLINQAAILATRELKEQQSAGGE